MKRLALGLLLVPLASLAQTVVVPYQQSTSSYSTALIDLHNGYYDPTGATGWGMKGSSHYGVGLYGTSNVGYGVWAYSGGTTALYANTAAASGVAVRAVGETAMVGYSSKLSAGGVGIHGYVSAPYASTGVFAEAQTYSDGTGLEAKAVGLAAYIHSTGTTHTTAHFAAENGSSYQPVVTISHSGYGPGLQVGAGNHNSIGATNNSNSSATVDISNTGTGNVLYAHTTATSARAVEGYSQSGRGVFGETSSGVGVYGLSNTGVAIEAYSYSSTNAAIKATGTANNGITTYSQASGAAAIHAENTYGNGYGIVARTGTNGTGVYGDTGSNVLGWAGYFTGKVHVGGNFTKAGGSFKIDHPLDPQNKYLYHSFVESPDMMNVYNGIVTLSATGTATVQMPSWFSALNKDFRYQLTSIGQFSPVYISGEMNQNNQFAIAGGAAGQRISWQVTGIRQDNWANQNRIPLEVAKTGNEVGKYLHPGAFGRPQSDSIPSGPGH